MNCTVQELAGRLGVEFVGNGDVHIEGVNTLEHAGPHELSFLANPKYLDQVEATRAGAVILHPEHASRVETALLSTNPYLDFARVVQMFATPQGSFNGQSFMAFVHPEADVHESATIYPFAYVGAGAVIEAEVTLFSGVYVGEECRVGRGCILYPNAVLMARTTLGESVTLHPGAVVGSDGFGFAQAAAGFEKFPQIGRSVIEDGVEIGANTTIDRAALGESRVGKGTKIDNLVQLGHNVTVGENSIIVAQVGIAGSTTIGSNVILAGQVGIAGHLSIGDNVRIGAKSGVGRDIPPGTDMSGIPAMEHRRFLKVASLLNRLPEMSKRLRQLEIELAKVKEQGASDEHE